MALHVGEFSGGIVVDGSADAQKTNECQVLDSFDISPRGQLIVTTDASDYLTLDDNVGPAAWVRLWALLECAGFNFSKVVAVGEGDSGTGQHYIMTSFNREGEVSPYLWASGGSQFGSSAPLYDMPTPMVTGAIVLGADFNGIFPVRFAAPGVAPVGGPVNVRLYLVNIGAREGVAPNTAPGLYVLTVVPPDIIPLANQIGRFDSLGSGSSGLFTVPAVFNAEGEGQTNGGTHGRQLYFRGIIAYNNFVFGWGYDASDEQITPITGITNANPGNVTAVAHGRTTGDRVRLKGVAGMTQVNGIVYTITVTGANNFTIGVDTTAFGVYGAASGIAVYGNGDGPARVMFSNLGRPLKWGFDNVAALGTDRLYTDSDAIVLGDAGELLRGAIKWEGKLIFGSNKGLHFISGYGRDSFLSDGATPIMRSYNVIGPNAMVEGPDKLLYGVCEQGLWCLPSLGAVPLPLFEQLRDFKSRSNGYWDLIWTDYTRSAAAYPGVTNQDLVWMAVDWERQQVIVGIPWCSIANGYGYGTDTVILKYHVKGGGFTRQQFTGVQYTAAGYFRSESQQAACRFLGTATAAKATVQRYGYKAVSNVLGWAFDAAGSSPVLPTVLPKVRFGPYLPFGPDAEGVVKRLYAVLSWDALGTPMHISGITQANPAVVTTTTPHGFVTGQVIDIFGVNNMVQVVGGPYTITVTGSSTFSLNGVNSTAFTAYGGASPLSTALPLIFNGILSVDEQIVYGQIEAAMVSGISFVLSIRAVPPTSPTEGDLWLDISETDLNLGNATAGVNTLAQGGYLMRMRRDNQSVAITGATKANPCVVTAPTHGFKNGQRISIRNVAGMTQLNNDASVGPYTKDFTIVVIDADHFSLVNIDSTAYGVYTSGGTAALAWTLIPGMGGSGNRATIPLPVVRRPGTRFTLDLNATTLARRFQCEGIGFNPGDGNES